VLQFRQSFIRRRVGDGIKLVSQKELLVADLNRAWNRSTEAWEPVSVAFDDVTTVKVCPAAYGLLCGVVSSTLRQAMDDIRNLPVACGQVVVPNNVSVPVAQRNREQRSEDFCMLRSYVQGLLDKHEAVPAPGAHQPGRMTHITKATWKSKWDAVLVYFKDAPRVPGSVSMLKKAWAMEERLKEKKACSHSKCNICSQIDKNMDAVCGVQGDVARTARENNQRAQREHEEMHLSARTELDNAGLRAFVEPRAMWTILADAATQRNFMLPKFQFRVPKKLANRPFWSYKLMATYAYGYGFTPFLVHSSQTMGANLTWTVIWLTLTAMRKHYGYWPDVLHLTVDNTTGENKNETLLYMCAWLVASGRFKQVRVLFLLVGHTHVIIDHIFGVVTVGLRRKELLLPSDLIQNINGSLAENPQYMAKPVQTLHCLWDFKAWCKATMETVPIDRLFKGNVQDIEGSYSGMYDLLFKSHRTDLVRLQYREHCSHPWLPNGSEGSKLIGKLPDTPPELQKMKPWAVWSIEGTKSVKDTITMCLEFARTLTAPTSAGIVKSVWQRHFSEVPESVELLDPKLKLKFEFFRDVADDVLRIGMVNDGTAQSSAQGTEEQESEAAYRAWKIQNLDVRTEPLALDPVVSQGGQSNAEYAQRKAALQASMRPDAHPSINPASPIFMGEFVLALMVEGTGVNLYNVQNVEGQRSCLATDLNIVGVQYEHLPNAAVNGLFGTFKMKMTLADDGSAKRNQTRRIIPRAQVKVFNASLRKTKEGSFLTIRSLRALALALPAQYPFPERREIPSTHLDDSDEDLEEEEEEEEPAPRAGRRQQRKPAARGSKTPAAAAAGSSRGASRRAAGTKGRPAGTKRNPTAAEDSEEEESDSSDEESDASDDDLSSEETSADRAAMEEVRAKRAAAEHPCSGAGGLPVPAVPALMPPPVELELDKVYMLNMVNDAEYEMLKYPCALVYVCNLEPLLAYWFHIPESQLTDPVSRRSRNTPRPFRADLKNVTFHKYWNKANWWTSKTKPPEELILQNWYKYKIHKNWVMPLPIPQPTDPRKIRMADTFRLPMGYVTDTLIPACLAAGCEHKD
jgi:hypothetical protein